eukprot:5458136-Prymnesium_polylepis.1
MVLTLWGKAVGEAVGVGGKPPAVSDVAGAAPAAYDDGYQLVVSRRRGAGAQRPKAAKEQGLTSNVGTPTGGLRVGVCTLDGVLAHRVLAQLRE